MSQVEVSTSRTFLWLSTMTWLKPSRASYLLFFYHIIIFYLSSFIYTFFHGIISIREIMCNLPTYNVYLQITHIESDEPAALVKLASPFPSARRTIVICFMILNRPSSLVRYLPVRRNYSIIQMLSISLELWLPRNGGKRRSLLNLSSWRAFCLDAWIQVRASKDPELREM